MLTHKTIFDDDFILIQGDKEFNYQLELTDKLDSEKSLFNQNVINEIVLWKLNRYARIDNNTLTQLNEIDPNTTELDQDKSRVILKNLLSTKGIRLPMASTILRFKNKNVYQIIDQRVYRIINKGKKLELNQNLSQKNIQIQIDLYFQYLVDLKNVCIRLEIPFDKSDRILYMADKRLNSDIPLDNYSNKNKFNK